MKKMRLVLFCVFALCNAVLADPPSPGTGLGLMRLGLSDLKEKTSADSHHPESWGGLFRTIYNWGAQMGHVGKGLYHVINTVWIDPLPSGLYGKDHPWCTGHIPGTKEKIWPHNILYASPRRSDLTNTVGAEAGSDEKIVSIIGTFLRARAARAARSENYPRGRSKWEVVENEGSFRINHSHPFPFAVDYIHGAVHYNGVSLLFNDIRDGIEHISNPKFMKELVRFAHEEKREVTIIFRDPFHGVSPEFAELQLQSEIADWKELAESERKTQIKERRLHLAMKLNAFFTTHMRSEHYWFGNPQGPFRKKALWGDWAPYPAMNAINGSWVHDVDRNLRIRDDDERERAIVRPPLEKGKYFSSEYFQDIDQIRKDARHDGIIFTDKLLAVFTSKRIEKTKKIESSNFNFVDSEDLLGIVPKEILDRAEIKRSEYESERRKQLKNKEDLIEAQFRELQTHPDVEKTKLFSDFLNDYVADQSDFILDSANDELLELLEDEKDCPKVAAAYSNYQDLKTLFGEDKDFYRTQAYHSYFVAIRNCLQVLGKKEGIPSKSLYPAQGYWAWGRAIYHRLTSLPYYLGLIPEGVCLAYDICGPHTAQEGQTPFNQHSMQAIRKMAKIENISVTFKGREILEQAGAFENQVNPKVLNILTFNHTLHTRDKIAVSALNLPHAFVVAQMDSTVQKFFTWPITTFFSNRSDSIPGLIPVGHGHRSIEKLVNELKKQVSHNLVIFPQGTAGSFNQMMPSRESFSQHLVKTLLDHDIQVRIIPMTVVNGPAFLQSTVDSEAFDWNHIQVQVDEPIFISQVEDLVYLNDRIRLSWMQHLPHNDLFLHGHLRTHEALFLREQYVPIQQLKRIKLKNIGDQGAEETSF